MGHDSLAKHVKCTLKRPVRFVAKDWSFGMAFPHEYRKASARCDVDRRKVLFVDTKSSTMPDAFWRMFAYLQDNYSLDVKFIGLAQSEHIGWIEYYRRCLDLCRNMADARTVFLADASDLVSCLPLRPETNVIQLWHACGAFKKWGMSTAALKFGCTKREIDRHPFYRNLSLVTVSSPEVEWAYREAMDLNDTPETVRAIGVSRTDRFFDPSFLKDAREEVASVVPEAAEKRTMLYAPTFRGHVSEAEGPDFIDWQALHDAVGDEWIVLVKHHPFVKNPPAIPRECSGFVFPVPDIPTDRLLVTADALVTDYSSIIFEYSLMERPMAFLSPDIETYGDWRGFYYPFDEMTPGPTLGNTDDLAAWMRSLDEAFNPFAIVSFRQKFMCSCDGHATERIAHEVFGDLSEFAKKPVVERMLDRNPSGPDISIIVPAHNAEKTICRAVDSVLAQTYPINRMELVLVDDCSSDGTWKLLRGYAEAHPNHVKLARTATQSGSPASPRNRGLSEAQGEYVLFLDADDWLGPEAVERMLAHALDWNSDVLLVKLRGEGGRQVPLSMFVANQPDVDLLHSKVMWTFGSYKLYRRSLIADLRFPDFMPEDISFVLRAYCRANTISVAADYPYYHLCAVSDGNISLSTWDDVDSNLAAFEDIFGFVSKEARELAHCKAFIRRLFTRDVCRTLETIGKDPDHERARRQLEKLREIIGPFYDPAILITLPEERQALLEAAFAS